MRLIQRLCAKDMKYFQRYIARMMFDDHASLRYSPLLGWVEDKKENWYYGENRPWTSAFKQENSRYVEHPKVYVEPIKEWNIFKGDRVEILVGKDKGKQGIIGSIIKERNWVYVEGLNCEYETSAPARGLPPICYRREKPLLVTTQVKLVDPADECGTDVDWRYTEDGERVRVSRRSGRIIPLPIGADITDSLIVPSTYRANQAKDTSSKDLLEVTYKPSLRTFDDEIMKELGIHETRTRAKTYYY